MPADGMPVTIRENAPPFRILNLAGADRPERPVSVATEQRATQTHYPGSGKASVQFMGTREDPIILRGWFQDALSAFDGGPQARVDLARGIMQGGNLCTIMWGTAIHRTGRIKRFNPEYHRATRIRYEIEFEVDEQHELVAKVPLPTGGAAASIKAALEAALAAVKKAVAVARVAKVIVGVVR